MRQTIFGSILTVGLLIGSNLQAKNSVSVRAEQQALKDKGLDPGPVDGVNGPLTRAALRQFQAKQNLKEDGRLGPQTRDALGLQAGSAKTKIKASGENIKTGYGEGGKDIGRGSKEMAHDVVHGHPIEGAKEISKGVGHGVVKMGKGSGHAAENAAKSVKTAVTGDNKDK